MYFRFASLIVMSHSFILVCTMWQSTPTFTWKCEGRTRQYCIIKDAMVTIPLSAMATSRPLANVVALTFRNSSIAKWPSLLLTYFPHLRKIVAEDCKIANLPTTVFGNTRKSKYWSLESLYLSKNSIGIIEDNCFQNAASLYMLDLSENCITKLQDKAFSNLTMLLYLDLSHNRLTNVGPNVFGPLISIYSIDLSHNHLVTFNFDSIAVNQNLNEIIMNSNQIVSITSTNQTLNSSITSIRLMNNKLTDISALKRFRNLDFLSLSGNRNLQLSKSTFVGFSSILNQLFLADVNLTKTLNYTTIFEPLQNLWLLDIGKNDLHKFDFASFTPLQYLEILLIYQNDLRSIENYRNVREIFPALSTIDVTANRFKCIQLNLIRNRLKNMQIIITLYVDYFIDDNSDTPRHSDLQNNLIDCET